jgi:hypothetical protein
MVSSPRSSADQDVSRYGARTRWSFYLISFVFPIGGLIVWAVLSGRTDSGSRLIARHCLFAAGAATLLACACLGLDTLALPR